MLNIETLRALKARASAVLRQRRLPAAVKEEIQRDHDGLPTQDPGLNLAIDGASRWLCMAQDKSSSADGGVARDFSLINGWSSSYPETTGYIAATFLDHADRTGSDDMRIRARRMLDWLVNIQMPNGGFQGGKVDSTPVVPVVFNTGQILLGLSSGARSFSTYRQQLRRAADWLVEVQDSDGCWRKFPSPFAAAGEKTYDTHTAWGLLEAAKIEPNRGYADAALANIRWALTHQRSNGWFEKCCLQDPSQPLTHTIGYALRGVVEGYRYSGDKKMLEAARRTADGLLTALRSDGFLPGRLASDWSGAVNWACLTGTVQIACCWFMLFLDTADPRYRDAGFAATRYVRRTMRFDGAVETRGGVKGAFPIDGRYTRYEYPSWAAKFLIDSLFLERHIR